MANFFNGLTGTACAGDTTRLGSYPAGASLYGVLDIAGNVDEWVSDWYGGGYYRVSPPVDPQGPASGSSRALRGGSFNVAFNNSLRLTLRGGFVPESWRVTVGFRCSRSQ